MLYLYGKIKVWCRLDLLWRLSTWLKLAVQLAWMAKTTDKIQN